MAEKKRGKERLEELAGTLIRAQKITEQGGGQDSVAGKEIESFLRSVLDVRSDYVTYRWRIDDAKSPEIQP